MSLVGPKRQKTMSAPMTASEVLSGLVVLTVSFVGPLSHNQDPELTSAINPRRYVRMRAVIVTANAMRRLRTGRSTLSPLPHVDANGSAALDPSGCHFVGRYRYELILHFIREASCPSSIRVQRLKLPMMIPIPGSKR